VNVRLICLSENNSNNMKLKKKIKTLNEIGITKSANLIGISIKKSEITPNMALNRNMNGSGNDLFSGVDVDKDSI
jgi:hypothetical protein